MSYKKTTYVALGLILLLGIGYFISINTTPTMVNTNKSVFGPRYFPNVLAGLLVVSCLISLIQTVRKEDHPIHIPQIKMILFTLVLTAVFVASWFKFGLFYLQTFIFLAILFTVYRFRRERIQFIVVTSLIAALVTVLFLYILFGRFMSVSF